MTDLIRKHIQESIETKQAILASQDCIDSIKNDAEQGIDALARGNKSLLAGNGGSAADAQHIAAELVGRFEKERPGLPAIAITTDTSALTAIGNDYGYNFVFSRQVQALSREGDVFIGISTSGNSANIIEAVKAAKEAGVTTICLTGNGGRLPAMCDAAVQVPSSRTATVQESHIMIGHLLCALIEA